ncbi:ABC transporter ATP-binding protein [Streptomyces sp. NPDC001515]
MDTLPAVRARGIVKSFGDVIALDGVDLEVTRGRIHGLAGPNGAGKTTLLGLLLGLATADAGGLEILGTPVGRALSVPEGVAGFVDGPGLYPSLTARQNLSALAALHGAGRADTAIEETLEQVGLGDVADDRTRGFSLGMRQRLGLAAALLAEPRLLVLDEPANGLDPAGKRHIHGVLTGLAARGTAVVLSSHRMDDLEALCSEVTILSTGRVVHSGPLDELAAQDRALDYRVLTSDPGAAMKPLAARWNTWKSRQRLTGPQAVPDFANPAQMNHFTWYETHNWKQPYPGEKKIFAPQDVPGAAIPPPESDG